MGPGFSCRCRVLLSLRRLPAFLGLQILPAFSHPARMGRILLTQWSSGFPCSLISSPRLSDHVWAGGGSLLVKIPVITLGPPGTPGLISLRSALITSAKPLHGRNQIRLGWVTGMVISVRGGVFRILLTATKEGIAVHIFSSVFRVTGQGRGLFVWVNLAKM